MKKLSVILLTGLLVQITAVAAQTKDVEVKMRNVKPFHFVYYEFTGPYSESFKNFLNLKKFLVKRGEKTGDKSVGIFFDDPKVTPPYKLRSHIGCVVSKQLKLEGEFKYKFIPGFKAVSARYTSFADIEKTWNALVKYTAKMKLMITGPGFEFYTHHNDPKIVDAECLLPVIQIRKK